MLGILLSAFTYKVDEMFRVAVGHIETDEFDIGYRGQNEFQFGKIGVSYSRANSYILRREEKIVMELSRALVEIRILTLSASEFLAAKSCHSSNV